MRDGFRFTAQTTIAVWSQATGEALLMRNRKKKLALKCTIVHNRAGAGVATTLFFAEAIHTTFRAQVICN